VREGAAQGAPTAPHATPRAPGAAGKPTGPERFWDRRRVRVALAVCVVLSLAFHYVAGPWSIVPSGTVEFHDIDGELSIPVDLLQGEPEPPPPPPEPAPPAPKGTVDPNAPGALDAGPPPRRDAGPRADSGPSPDGASDAAGDATPKDAAHPDGPPNDGASFDGSGAEGGAAQAGEAGLVAASGSDGGPGQGGPGDAVGMIGAAGNVQAGPQNVVLVVNMAVIRSHPVGAKLGPLLSAIPQWDDFIGGSGVDPVRDTDWVLINGPSLMNTGRDAIIIHYSAPDAVVDHAIHVVAHKYDQGGVFDAGVPGVKAALGHADRYERVFLRPQPHLLAVVPRDYATTAARLLQHASVKAPRAGEALRIKLLHPHNSIGIRGMGVEIPDSIAELRVWIVPRADGGADVYGEGDTPDAAAAEAAAQDMRKIVRALKRNLLIAVGSQGVLDALEFSGDGSTMRLHLAASRDQIQALASLAAGYFGVDLPLGPLVDP
jgi:hypothetical protein